jgi:hypothetical protein
VFKSTDRGASWKPVNAGLPSPSVISLAIDPAVPDTLYVNLSFSVASISSGGVFVSTDGGVSWTIMNPGLTYIRAPRSLLVDPATPNRLYGYGDSAGLGVTDFRLVAAGICGDAPCACGDLVTISRTLGPRDPVSRETCPADGPGVTLDLGATRSVAGIKALC